MEECANCNEEASYQCVTCTIALCGKHKSEHEKVKRNHRFEKTGIILDPQTMSEIVANLSSKITLANQCEERILDETGKLIVKIKNLCVMALEIIKEKKKIFTNLLIDCQKKISVKQVKEIESLLKTSFEINIPHQEFKEIDNFYASNFLLSINQISSIKIEDAKHLLAQAYGLFLEGHTGPVMSIALTSDNKYIVSGSNDCTVRVWSLQDKIQQALLLGHKDWVNSVVITSDNDILSLLHAILR